MQEVAESSRRRCETLLMSFQEHTSLLAADTIMLRSRLNVNRRAAVMQDWIDMIERFRWGSGGVHEPSPLNQRGFENEQLTAKVWSGGYNERLRTETKQKLEMVLFHAYICVCV